MYDVAENITLILGSIKKPIPFVTNKFFKENHHSHMVHVMGMGCPYHFPSHFSFLDKKINYAIRSLL